MVEIIEKLIDAIEKHQQTTVVDRMMVEAVRSHDFELYNHLEEIKQKLDELNI